MYMRNKIATATLWGFFSICVFVQSVFAQGLAPSQEIANRFKFAVPSPAVIITLALSVAAVIGILITIHLNSRRKHSLTEQEVSVKLFREGCVKSELGKEEVEAMQALAVFVPQRETEAHHLFDNHVLFERAMEAHVSRLVRTGAGDNQDDMLHAMRRKLGYSVLASDLPLASTRNIAVGQEVSVSVPKQGSHPRGGQVVRMSEFSMTVKLTDGMSGSIGADAGSSVMITFLRHGDGGYSVPATVCGVEAGKFSVYHTLKFTRNQNRKHIRLEASLPLAYRVVQYSDPDKKPTADSFKARTVDISGGGLCFIADIPLQMGDEVLMSLQIPGYSMGGIKARIVKEVTVEGKTGTQHKHLTQFMEIEAQQREKIVKYIFEKQREMLQMR